MSIWDELTEYNTTVTDGVVTVGIEAATYFKPDQSSLKPVIDFNPSLQFLIPTIYESSEGGIRNIDIFICGVIDATPRYLNAVARIEALLPSLTDKDTVTMYISSPGGNVHTATKITSAMEFCKAHIKTIAYGMIASAATLVWSYGHELIIYPGQAVMVHMSSHGDIDNTNRILGRATNLKSYITRIAITQLHTKGLLSDEQVERITENGEDIYILSDNAVFIGHSASLNDVPDDADPAVSTDKDIPEASDDEVESSRKQQEEVEKITTKDKTDTADDKATKDDDTDIDKSAKAMFATEAFIEEPVGLTQKNAPYYIPNIEKDMRTGYYVVTVPSYTYNINTYSNCIVGIEHFILTRSPQDTVLLKVAYLDQAGSTGVPLSLISAMKKSPAKIIVYVDTMLDDSFAYVAACADHHLITNFGCIQLSGRPSGDDYYRHGAYLEHALNWAFQEMKLLNDEERTAVRNGRIVMIDSPELKSRSTSS